MCFSCRLSRILKWNTFLEIILAVTAPSSAIAGLWFWNTPLGGYLWKVFGVIAAITAMVKPFLNYVEKIKKYEEVLAGYRMLDHDLKEISILISEKKRYNNNLRKDFRRAYKRKGYLINKNPETKEDKKLIEKCQKDVLKELPVENFCIPIGRG